VIGILGSLLAGRGSDPGGADVLGSGTGCADATLVIAIRATVVVLTP
jgi:hypothetical protein